MWIGCKNAAAEFCVCIHQDKVTVATVLKLVDRAMGYLTVSLNLAPFVCLPFTLCGTHVYRKAAWTWSVRCKQITGMM